MTPATFTPKELDFFWKISESIVSGRYLKDVLQLIVTMTAEMVGSKICSILLLDENTQELAIEATQSLSQAYLGKPKVKVGDSISGRVIREKQPVVVPDVTKEKLYRYPQIARAERIVSMLSVPMMIESKAIGVINVYTTQAHDFSEAEIKLLRAVANQAAVVIQNSKLREEAIAARNAIELRKLQNRAKAILMRERQLSEDAAHRLLLQLSRNSRKSMREVAEAILLTYSGKSPLAE
jgi:GAF domain-containing protein